MQSNIQYFDHGSECFMTKLMALQKLFSEKNHKNQSIDGGAAVNQRRQLHFWMIVLDLFTNWEINTTIGLIYDQGCSFDQDPPSSGREVKYINIWSKQGIIKQRLVIGDWVPGFGYHHVNQCNDITTGYCRFDRSSVNSINWKIVMLFWTIKSKMIEHNLFLTEVKNPLQYNHRIIPSWQKSGWLLFKVVSALMIFHQGVWVLVYNCE